MSEIDSKAIIVLGSETQTGCYLLRLVINKPLAVCFGRFQGGQPIEVPPGEFIYIGSAMGQKGSTTLARRLLRHASRAHNKPPHAIREQLLNQFQESGIGPIGLRPPTQKRLFWNIDYLLQEAAVTLSQLIILRTAVALEAKVAQFLETDPHTTPLASGLGASDHAGHTHLLCVTANTAWWQVLPYLLAQFL